MSISFRTIRPPKCDLGKGYIFRIVLGFAFGFYFPLRLFAIVWKEAIGWSELSGTSRHLNGHYLGNFGGCDKFEKEIWPFDSAPNPQLIACELQVVLQKHVSIQSPPSLHVHSMEIAGHQVCLFILTTMLN